MTPENKEEDKLSTDLTDDGEPDFEEPSWEDFLPNEEDEYLQERQRKRMAFFQKVIVFIIAFSLVVSTLQIWPRLFNLSSLKFLQKSAQLSQIEEIQSFKKAVVLIGDGVTKGTGFAISEDGLIVTNRHVVEKMFPIEVSFPNGQLFIAEPLYIDKEIDLALIKVNGEGLPHLVLGESDSWKIDDHVYVIGNPLLHTQIVNEGEIIPESRKDGIMRLSAPIYSGNSGSPVIQGDGSVIGVVYAVSLKDGAGHAIPVEQVQERVQNLKNDSEKAP